MNIVAEIPGSGHDGIASGLSQFPRVLDIRRSGAFVVFGNPRLGLGHRNVPPTRAADHERPEPIE